MKTPKVSIIIPCYNQGKYIAECLDSVIAQTVKDFEAIVINDGSSDNSLSVVQKYVEKYPFIHLIDQKNQGVIAARNNGIKKAKGKYIFPLDGDDKIAPTVLEKAVRVLDENPNIGIVGGKTMFFGAIEGPFELVAYHFPDILAGNCLTCSCMFRRSDWEKVGGYNPNMVSGLEDYDFWLSLIEIGREVYQFDDVFLYYRQLESSRNKTCIDERYKKMVAQIVSNHAALYARYPKMKNRLLGITTWKDKIIKRLIRTICLFIPVKSWRHRLRDIYKKGG